MTQQARHWVPRLKADGCDVVVVLCPGAVDKDNATDNAALDVARRVAGIDAVLVSHSVAADTGTEIGEQLVDSLVTKGKRVLLTQPRASGMRLSVMDLDLAPAGHGWRVTAAHSHLLDTAVVAEDAAITGALGDDHAVVRTYASSVIGTSRVALSAATARFEHSDELDFVNHVQGQTVKDAISGTPDEVLPVLSATAPFARGAGLPSGDVTVRDVGGSVPLDGDGARGPAERGRPHGLSRAVCCLLPDRRRFGAVQPGRGHRGGQHAHGTAGAGLRLRRPRAVSMRL